MNCCSYCGHTIPKYDAACGKILLGTPTWNNRDVVLITLTGLRTEAYRLRQCGFDVSVVVVDNGSTDGTRDLLEAASDVYKIYNSENVGIAPARNQLIDYSLYLKTKYTFFVDDDVYVVPHSVAEMANYLWQHQHEAFCLGVDFSIRTDNISCADRCCHRIYAPRLNELTAHGNYGIFLTETFKQFRFDPEFGPGWGWEDYDLGMQIQHATGLNCHVIQLRHYHAVRNSWTRMANQGVNMNQNFHERTEYIRKKWAGVEKYREFLESIKQYDSLQEPSH